MKMSITRNLVVLGLTVSSLLTNAQQREVNLEIHIDEPANGGIYQSGEAFPLTVSITNHGPDELVEGDSLFVILPSGEPTWGSLPNDIPVDSNFVLFSNELTMPVVESTTNLELCVQLADDPTNQITLSGSPISVSYIDPVPDNNLVCHTLTVEAAPSSIADKDLSVKTLQIYPNPASQVVQIPVDQHSIAAMTIRIQDISGRTVLSQHFDPKAGKSVEVNVQQLPEGMYMIERKQGKTRSVGKVTILH